MAKADGGGEAAIIPASRYRRGAVCQAISGARRRKISTGAVDKALDFCPLHPGAARHGAACAGLLKT
jgi:hypothetical protein